MTLIRKTLHSDIHQCPECGVPCSVARSAIEAAHHAQQSAAIACHKCDAVFQLQAHDESTLAMPADHRATDTEQAQAGTRMRYGTCPKCRGNFLMPAMPVADDLVVECPHCSMKMPPLAVMRLDARRHMETQPRARTLAASRHLERLKLAVILIIGSIIIASLPAMLILEMTPAAQPYESLAAPRPHFALRNSTFSPVSDANGTGVLVTVNLANIGTKEGVPDTVFVTLLDDRDEVITRRQIARLETPMDAGEQRPLVARFTLPPAQVANIDVSLSPR
ncbi:MAG: hypothetical protein ACON4I_06375 [Candidatus Puniceispirillaceae bacterium]